MVPSSSQGGQRLDSSHHAMNTPDVLLKAARLVTLNQQLRAVEQARAEDSLPICLAVVKGDEYCLQATHMVDRKVKSNVVGVLAHLVEAHVLDDLAAIEGRLATDEELQVGGGIAPEVRCANADNYDTCSWYTRKSTLPCMAIHKLAPVAPVGCVHRLVPPPLLPLHL
jgi:hypothetical protein